MNADDPRWAAILGRDRAADGSFWYRVATTGIYCRPSCPSRRPALAHVTVHASPEEARAAGARACRRCDPDGLSPARAEAALIAAACRSIAAADTPPSLAALAQAAGLSASRFHRLFRDTIGVTPHRYAAGVRDDRFRAALPAADSVADAVFAAGFGSGSRGYAGAGARLGMTPGRVRAGGAGERLQVAVLPCALGQVLVAASERGIAAILMGDDADALHADLAARFPRATLEGGDRIAPLAGQVVAAVDGSANAALPLDLRGTAFQMRVWDALSAIPAGETRSYAEVAAAIGAPTASRAVAAACAANAHAVVVPCHRVVRGDGGLSGYRWGVERKRRLLDRERG